MKPNPDYPLANYCAAVAFLINSDNLCSPFTDKVYDAEMVYRSNSHGELFGVLEACELVRRMIDHLVNTTDESKGDKMRTALDTIVKGGSVAPEKEYGSAYGMLCMTMLYQMPEGFQKAVDAAFKPKP